jgi:PAS domain-containing protein
MEHNSSAARVGVHSLLSLLAEGRGRHAALSVLHERALHVTGGRTSVLFEPHPTTGHLHPTSGAGLDLLSVEPWVLEPGESALVSQAFTRRTAVAIRDLRDRIPRLHSQLGTAHAVLLALSADDRRVGLLGVGVDADPHEAATVLAASEVPGGFTLALELTRLRQREAFEADVRQLLDEFTQQVSSTLDLGAALPSMCDSAARLFGADRMTIWLHDRVSRALEPFASSDRSVSALEAPVRADDPLMPAAAALRAAGAGLAVQPAAVTATLTVPLRGYRRALGALVFEGVRIDAGEDLALLARADELGRHLANAIETTQLLAAIGASRRELEELFEATPCLLLVLGEGDAIVRVNRAFAEAAGQPIDAIQRRPLADLITSDLLQWLRTAPGASPATAARIFDEPGLGGRYEFTRHVIAHDGGGTLRVVTGYRLHDPREQTTASRATL